MKHGDVVVIVEVALNSNEKQKSFFNDTFIEHSVH